MKITRFCQNWGRYWYSVVQAENDLNVQVDLEGLLWKGTYKIMRLFYSVHQYSYKQSWKFTNYIYLTHKKKAREGYFCLEYPVVLTLEAVWLVSQARPLEPFTKYWGPSQASCLFLTNRFHLLCSSHSGSWVITANQIPRWWGFRANVWVIQRLTQRC